MRHTPEQLGLGEKKALRLIARREERSDPSPGLLEIGCVVGLEGTRDAQELVSRLARDGYLIRDEGWERMLRLTGLGWRLFAEENPSRPDDGGLVVVPVGGKASSKRPPRYADSPSHAPAGDVPVDPGDGPAVWPRMPVSGTDT